MNILKDPRRAPGAQQDAAECQRMVALLDEQIGDLEDFLTSLRRRHARWTARLDAARQGSPIPASRAGHGALRDIVLDALKESPDGLTLEQLRDRASRNLPIFNPKSLRQTLARLRLGEVVEHRNGRWRSCA